MIHTKHTSGATNKNKKRRDKEEVDPLVML